MMLLLFSVIVFLVGMQRLRGKASGKGGVLRTLDLTRNTRAQARAHAADPRLNSTIGLASSHTVDNSINVAMTTTTTTAMTNNAPRKNARIDKENFQPARLNADDVPQTQDVVMGSTETPRNQHANAAPIQDENKSNLFADPFNSRLTTTNNNNNNTTANVEAPHVNIVQVPLAREHKEETSTPSVSFSMPSFSVSKSLVASVFRNLQKMENRGRLHNDDAAYLKLRRSEFFLVEV